MFLVTVNGTKRVLLEPAPQRKASSFLFKSTELRTVATPSDPAIAAAVARLRSTAPEFFKAVAQHGIDTDRVNLLRVSYIFKYIGYVLLVSVALWLH